jgi:hypothetical protein
MFLRFFNWLKDAVMCLWSDHRAGRMFQWAVFSVIMYALAAATGWSLLIHAALIKGANVNAGAFLGYWVDRTLFNGFDLKLDADPNSIEPISKAARLIARAVVCGSCIYGLSVGIGA